MSEVFSRGDAEFEHGEPELDRAEIVRLMKERKIDIELEDFNGRDDNDVLGVIASLAIYHDFDPEEVLRFTVPLENMED